MKDDVDHATKQRRLAEVIEVFREKVQQRNVKSEKGKLRVVLVEFDSRRSTKDVGESKEKAARRGTEWGSGRTSDSGQERKECQRDRPLRLPSLRRPSHPLCPRLGRRWRHDLPP